MNIDAPKKSHRQWRRLARKFQRKRRRRELAGIKLNGKQINEENVFDDDIPTQIAEIEHRNAIENQRWHQYDYQVVLKWNARLKKREELQRIKDEERARIAEDFEKEQNRLADERAETQRLADEIQLQEALLLGQITEYINGNGSVPSQLHGWDELNPMKPVCGIYEKLGTCRFGLRCMRNHKRPRISCFLLISDFFTNIRLNNTGKASEYGDDISIEFDDEELYRDFAEFFEDVCSEFERYGSVVQLRVCQNIVKNLRGNVYVEYKCQREAMRAYQNMQGRFYGGRTIHIEFCSLNWNAALCGLATYPFGRHCSRGLNCNYLHVFKNPRDRFSLRPLVENRQSMRKSNLGSVKHESQRATSEIIEPNIIDPVDDDRNWRWSESPEQIKHKSGPVAENSRKRAKRLPPREPSPSIKRSHSKDRTKKYKKSQKEKKRKKSKSRSGSSSRQSRSERRSESHKKSRRCRSRPGKDQRCDTHEPRLSRRTNKGTRSPSYDRHRKKMREK